MRLIVTVGCVTFKEQEFNSDHLQCDSVSSKALLFIFKPVQTRPNHGVDLSHNEYAKPQSVNSHRLKYC
jgi:hypothetical protein